MKNRYINIQKISLFIKNIAVSLVLFFLAYLIAYSIANASPASVGSLKVCRVIVDNNDVVALNNTNLPSGAFSLKLLYRSTTTDPQVDFQVINFVSSGFQPTEKVISTNTDPDMQCQTFDNLPFGFYYYEKEIVYGDKWFATQYNDQFLTTVNSLVNFYNLDRKSNVDSDGVIELGVSRPNRILILLNRYDPLKSDAVVEPAPSTISFSHGSSGSGFSPVPVASSGTTTSTTTIPAFVSLSSSSGGGTNVVTENKQSSVVVPIRNDTEINPLVKEIVPPSAFPAPIENSSLLAQVYGLLGNISYGFLWIFVVIVLGLSTLYLVFRKKQKTLPISHF